MPENTPPLFNIANLTGILAPDSSPTYAQGIDLTRIFGNENVTKWASVDNDSNQDTIYDRVRWAIGIAYEELNGLLRDGPYGIPFTTPVPAKAIDCNARLAGVYLYDSRGIADVDNEGRPYNKMTPHRKLVMDWIDGIMSNRIKLEIEPASPTNTPQIVRVETSRDRLGGRFGQWFRPYLPWP